MTAAEVIVGMVGNTFGSGAEFAEDLLSTLKGHGFAVVELPKPEGQSPNSWLDGSVTATTGMSRVRLNQDDHRLTSGNAREVAAALLAAADAAEAAHG